MGPKNDPVVLTLLARHILRGKVQLDPVDEAWNFVYLSYRRRDTDAWVRPVGLDVKAPDWAFQLADLAPGEYELSAGLTGAAPVVTTTVRVSGRTEIPTLVLPRLTSAHVLEVRVLGPDGTAAAREAVSFTLQERQGNSTIDAGVRTLRRADGTFLVALSTPSVVQRERLRDEGIVHPEVPSDPRNATFGVKVTHKGQVKEVEFVPGSTTRVEVTFE